ncbi:hypothetical protein CES86_0915 [Brucella lupini]|uniref:Uncharacterized protein n=1 Tax=Brucella lupini TaxID=255457 RepID=A0A256GWA3_9HYPH|nr:hypothetical protein CES86_0915 [Brucella lupini]
MNGYSNGSEADVSVTVFFLCVGGWLAFEKRLALSKHCAR